jgi:hypothetical protein
VVEEAEEVETKMKLVIIMGWKIRSRRRVLNRAGNVVVWIKGRSTRP